jgi:hypothetical protein
VLLASPPKPYEVVVIPVWFTVVVEKLELVDTCRPYDVAPLEGFQLSTVGLVGTPVAPSEGDESVGDGGDVGDSVVVKYR